MFEVIGAKIEEMGLTGKLWVNKIGDQYELETPLLRWNTTMSGREVLVFLLGYSLGRSEDLEPQRSDF